jgi:uncharacterized protein (DUF302 family)
MQMSYGFSKFVPMSYERAIERVTEELKKEGFGVLTTIDVKETLKKKLNVEFPKYVILGACNPSFAHQTLQADDQMGLLLPCNVVVQEKDGRTSVSVFDPMVMMKVMDNEQIRPVAEEVQQKLQRVLSCV